MGKVILAVTLHIILITNKLVEEKLDDNKLIMAQVKKWPKKGNTPTLVFKSSDKKKLQTIQVCRNNHVIQCLNVLTKL